MKEFFYKINFYNILIGFLILSVLNSAFFGGAALESVTYRIFSTFLGLLVLGYGITNNHLNFLRGNVFKLYLIFVFIYLFRILIDLFIFNIRLKIFGNLPIFYLSALTYTVIFPLSIATIVNLNIEKVVKNAYYIYAVPFIVHIMFSLSSPAVFGVVEDRQSGFENIGLNTISMFAAIIAAWTIFRLLDSRFSILYKAFFGAVLLIVFYTLAVAATRSAFVALGIVVLLYLAANFKSLSNSKFAFNLVILVGVVIASAPYWINWFDLIVKRFTYGVERGSTGRDHIYPKAIELFLNNPVFGGSFVLPNEAYFHNSILDAFVSTGLFGGILFLILNFKVMKICFSWFKRDSPYIFFAVGFVITFISSLFTSNLFSNYVYWSYLLCIVVISQKIKFKTNENNN